MASGNRHVPADGGNFPAMKIAVVRENEKNVQDFDSPD
jgi:hypothetical protein